MLHFSLRQVSIGTFHSTRKFKFTVVDFKITWHEMQNQSKGKVLSTPKQGWTLALAHSPCKCLKCWASANHSSLACLTSSIFHRKEIN